MTITPEVAAAIQQFRLPDKLGFGAVNAPVMFSAEWQDGKWGPGQLLPYGPIPVLPGARALQYGELVFEGLKAYRVGQSRPNLFRADANCRRMQQSASRLSMAPVPDELFFGALEAVVRACETFIPSQSGQSLYLRPFVFGTESGYLLRNSTTFRFMVIANPVEAYASGTPSVAIERHDVRAAVGGVGAAKTAANYAASLRGSTAAVARGHAVALWLDAASHRYVQELSGMNFFAVIDGELHTPALDSAILPGVTRDSVITLARHLGYTVHERQMDIDELLTQIGSGRCSETFACGTAAIIMPISALADSDNLHKTRQINVVASRLREALLAIQERRAPDPFNWVRVIP
ncbi:MAG: branched-chain amino acid aminotransferase [Proteobacteria bacterium]|nr:branched-chain amino acid aminotransferase [Pseudomonadota bacterium]